MSVEMQYKIVCPAMWKNPETGQLESRLIDDCNTVMDGQPCPGYVPAERLSPPINPPEGIKIFPGGCAFPKIIRMVPVGFPKLEIVEDIDD